MSNPTNYIGAVVVFVDDDAPDTFNTSWQLLASEKGIKISIAAITGRVGTAGYLTKQELLNLQTAGRDILSHIKTHHDIGVVSDSVAHTEFKEAQDWMKENGFRDYEHIVYSGGLAKDNYRIENIARQYYKYGISAWLSGNPTSNVMPVDNWALFRLRGDTLDLNTMIAALDNAIATNSLLIVMTHSQFMTTEVKQKISEFIDNVVSKNVSILLFTEAIKIKGNAVATGEYYDPHSTFVSVKGIGKFGSSNGMTVSSAVSTNNMDDPISVYTKDFATVRFMDSVRDTYTKVGGTMTVYRSSNHDIYSYAVFTPYNGNLMYIRKWNHSIGSWKAWEEIGKNALIVKPVAVLADNLLKQPITYFPVDSVFVQPIPKNTDSPVGGAGGIYKVYRFTDVSDTYSYAEYKIYNSNVEYRIRWSAGA